MQNKMIPFVILGMLLLGACSLGSSKSGIKKRDLDQYYQSSGVANYFLSELPDWANFSEAGKCKRSIGVKYLHMANMMQSFNLHYDQLVQFQYLFNREHSRLGKSFRKKDLLLKNEESLFYDVLDKIKSGIFAFRRPKFKRVNVIWIDRYLDSKNGYKKLKKVFKKKSLYSGHPVVISMCEGYDSISRILKESKLDKNSIRIIPAEMFSIYGQDGSTNFYFSLDITGLFDGKQKVYFYTPSGKAPVEIKGNYILKKL